MSSARRQRNLILPLGLVAAFFMSLVAFGAFTRSSGTNSSAHLTPLVDRHAVIAITCPHAPYFALADESGAEWQLIAAALKRAGKDPQYLYVPYDEAMRYLSKEYIQGVWVCGGSAIPDNGDYLSVPLLQRSFVVVTLASRELSVDNTDDLANLDVAIHPDILRVLRHRLGDLASTSVSLEEVTNHVLLTSLLFTGAVDALITERSIFRESLKRVPAEADPAQQIATHAIFEPIYPRILFRSKELRDRFDSAWKQIAKISTNKE